MRHEDWTRRSFLQSTLPSLTLVSAAPAYSDPAPLRPIDRDKFTPLDLSSFHNATPNDLPVPPWAQDSIGGAERIVTPTGEQNYRGVPFRLGPKGNARKIWLALSTQSRPWCTREVTIPIGQQASFLCLAQFCDWDATEFRPEGIDDLEKVGQQLAESEILYQDETAGPFPVRRRLETNAPWVVWGHLPFTAVPHREDAPRRLNDPLPSGSGWGQLQTEVQPAGRRFPTLWIWALQNPEPHRPIRALRLKSLAADPWIVCGLTLFHGSEHPLRYEPLAVYRLNLPDPVGKDPSRWQLDVDLGVVARSYVLEPFRAEEWLGDAGKGLGKRFSPDPSLPHLYVEVTASPDATLFLNDRRSGKSFAFELAEVVTGKETTARPAGARIEQVDPRTTWLHGRVIDRHSRRPTPVRLSFRSRDGRYLPPHGHRREVNNGWFQDYGADTRLLHTPFAYVDGTFQVELPVGEVYVELSKGFEYEPVRRKLQIQAGQRDLDLELDRFVDLRSEGWVTADPHVHFLSPSTAMLEAQAEGVNLIHLLAAQWGDLFTNVGDLPFGPLVSSDGETIVRPGTENRQHMLGHLGVLGVHGTGVMPLSTSGPPESWLGDPLRATMADWADECRRQEGLAVAMHFPYPTGEIAADIVMDKIDAVELYPYGFDNLRFHDWYRYLNCGYRLTAVGGTDKMTAAMPVGANRTYAYLGDESLSFASWARAVRSGRTFLTTGPLLFLQVDGHAPGDRIELQGGGATLDVAVTARSFVPVHRFELVQNGRIIAERTEASGTRDFAWRERVRVAGPGWLAARCSSNLGPTVRDLSIVAHTSPVYLSVRGHELFSPETASYLMTLIDGAELWARTLATRADPETHARILGFFEEARNRLHDRIHAHGGKKHDR